MKQIYLRQVDIKSICCANRSLHHNLNKISKRLFPVALISMVIQLFLCSMLQPRITKKEGEKGTMKTRLIWTSWFGLESVAAVASKMEEMITTP